MNWVQPTIGGILIGTAAVLLWLLIGRIAGISGIAAAAMKTLAGAGTAWPLLFVIGLGVGGWLMLTIGDISVPRDPHQAPILPLLAAGLLVGFGTRLGSGCTSGHGVCGISRFSVRSLVATMTFMLVGMLTATVLYG